MAVVALEIQRREPILAGAPFGQAGAYEKLIGVIRFAVEPALRAHQVIADLDRAPRNARGLRRVVGRFLPVAPGERGEPAAPCRRAQPRAQDGARTLQQRRALERPDDAGGLRQRLPHAPRLDRSVGRLAAGRAARGRHDGADGPARGGRVRAGALRVSSERPRCIVAPRGPLPHPASRRAPRRPGRRVDRTRPRRGTRGGGPQRVAVRPRRGRRSGGGRLPRLARRGIRARRDLRLLLRGAAIRRSSVSASPRSATPRASCASAPPRAAIPARGCSIGAASSASPRADASCATCSISASTRTRRSAPVFDSVIPHAAGARRGEFNLRFGQPSLNALHAVGDLFPFTDAEQGGSADGPARSLARPPARTRACSEGVHDQHRRRVLAG